MSYAVTSPLVITKKLDGSDLYLYEGAFLPDFVSADEVKRLETLGMVSEVEDAPDGEDAQPSRGRKKPTAESN